MSIQLKKNAIDLGIITTNGEAMLSFYRDVLGLRYLREMPVPGGGIMHQMLCGESVIKLVVLSKVPATAAPGGIQGGSGYRYWTISVTNAAEVAAKVEAAGRKMILSNVTVRPGVNIWMFEDPDGNWVELLSLEAA